MNPSTDARLKIMKGQRNFPLSTVAGLLEELDTLRHTNATLRQATTACVEFIGGHVIETDEGSLYCEPVPVVVLK